MDLNSYYNSVDHSSPIHDLARKDTEEGGNFPLPAVVTLWQQGLLSYDPVTVPGSWEKRSQPQNLVDGRGLPGETLPDEVTGWRPVKTQGSQAPVNPDKSISFKFLHPVALSSLKLSVGLDRSETAWYQAVRKLLVFFLAWSAWYFASFVARSWIYGSGAPGDCPFELST